MPASKIYMQAMERLRKVVYAQEDHNTIKFTAERNAMEAMVEIMQCIRQQLDALCTNHWNSRPSPRAYWDAIHKDVHAIARLFEEYATHFNCMNTKYLKNNGDAAILSLAMARSRFDDLQCLEIQPPITAHYIEQNLEPLILNCMQEL